MSNLAHLDIKPENLLIDKNLRLRIADFTFSRSIINEKGERSKMKKKSAFGSPEFLSLLILGIMLLRHINLINILIL